MAKANFCPIGDFFKSCPSEAKAGRIRGALDSTCKCNTN
ncbi:hypothetical protein [uncultured Gammaproteobacteria bacterium]|nr:hypothetical protein [uncultured Gammaproteobacteria bacterium]CAC9977503.1 hypothetical protein [uncultured Gammaproteobacteria bacterium]